LAAVKHSPTLVQRYGPWAFVAGASEGIGRAFAEELARHGFSLILAARRPGPLESLAHELRTSHGSTVRTLGIDLADVSLSAKLAEATRDCEVGLAVYNAAHSTQGDFLDHALEDHLRAIDLNCRGPLAFAHFFGGAMRARGRGGLILMSSLSGLQGTAMVASYAATKAFNTVLAEGLWEELRGNGVDVLACIAGATRTPTYENSKPADGGTFARPMEAARVAQDALASLGHGPSTIPGGINRIASYVMRFLPRAQAISLISGATRRMYGQGASALRSRAQGRASPNTRARKDR
jgi:short-subunit dehydrogenase